MKQGNWLTEYSRDVQSQHGEDGILKKVFEILQIDSGWCVELGAWDGKKYSNTYRLINECGWSAVLLEGNGKRFLELKQTYHSTSRVHCLQQYVGFEKNDGLDSALQRTPLPKDFDLLSIDIDGNDIHLWESLTDYQPKVIIIEYNPTIPNHVAFTQPRDMRLNQGSSLLALVNLGKKKGYELVATTTTNGIFVQKALYPLFGIDNNHIDLMRARSPHETAFFQLYDGTLVLEGNKKLLWSGIPIKEERLQVIPKFLRYFTPASGLQKTLRQLWRLLYKRNII